MINVKVDAAKALAGLKLLEDELKVKAVVAGLQKPGRAIRDTMKSLAPTRTGTLRKSISSRQLSKTAGERLDVFTGTKGRAQITIDPKATAAVLVGPNTKVKGRSMGYVGVVIEGGAGAHTIKPRGKNKRRFLAMGFNQGATGEVHHPGVRANPFMERSLEVNSSRVEALFFEGLQAHLDKLKR